MAARLGAKVFMIGKVGTDEFGRQYLSNFVEQGVDVMHVESLEGESTGVAPITVDEQGNNSIIIVVGANNMITRGCVVKARAEINECDVLLCQNETPLEATMEAFQIAQDTGTVTVYNPAPAPLGPVPEELYKLTDILCPNEIEAEVLCGVKVDSNENAEAAARMLIKRVKYAVILTLGERGTLLATKNAKGDVRIQHVATQKLAKEDVVDTTGAGDSFLGAFAFFLSRQKMRHRGLRKLNAENNAPFNFWDDIDEAGLRYCVKQACLVATVSVQNPGTQKSYPYAKDLPAAILQ